MTSDGDEPKGMKKKTKRVTLKDGSAGSNNGDAGNDGSEAKAFTKGMLVQVRSASNAKKLLAATIVRVHRSGDVTVQYAETGETEKKVPISRVQRESLSQPRSFKEGDAVLYQWPLLTPSNKEEIPWRSGVVKSCRSDGSFDIMDSTSDEVVKKVAALAVKKKAASKTRKQQNAEDDGVTSDDGGQDKEDKDLLLAVDAAIEFRNKKGVWRCGRIHRMRKDGTFDVVHGEEDGDDEEVVKRVERKQIRKPKRKKNKANAGGKDDSDDGKNSENDDDMKAIQNRKGLAKSGPKKKKKLQADDEDEEKDEETDSSDSLSGRRPRVSRSLPPLRINQMVQFPGPNGILRRGRIKLLRKDDDTCDLEHASDPETVSKRVPIDSIRPVSAFANLLWRPAWMSQQDPRVFPLNARVFYRTKDGLERKAVVVKIWKESVGRTGPAYDIEDMLDGAVVKKILGSKLRIVPWLNYSLPSLMPGSLFMGGAPQKGMAVRFRRCAANGRSWSWAHGVVVRVKKSDAACVVEYVSAKGTKEQVQVFNSDIQTRFFLPPSFQNPLKDLLPTLELPGVGMYAVRSPVEVSNGTNVFLGSVLACNEQENTYTIEYNDGRKEKHVSRDRVRLSLRKLRIGTDVTMIIEGPCKEVSTLDGEVAWVHRDEKVAVRIHGGNNDVFAEVCSHALLVDGKPAFTAPLSSTWLELLGFYLNVAAEIVVFMWLCFGMVVEMGEMIRLFDGTSSDALEDADTMTELYARRQVDWTSCALSPTELGNSSSYALIPKHVIATDRAWLVVLLAVKALFTLACALYGARLVYSKIMAIQDNFVDIREYQRDRVVHRRLGHVMGGALTVSYLTLLVYASLLNRFEYYCLLSPQTSAGSKSSNSMLQFDDVALQVDMFAVHSSYDTTVELLVGLAAKTTINLFRAMAFHVLLFAFPVSSTAFFKRVLYVGPSIGIAAWLSAMAVAALHVFYYVQKTEMVAHRVLTQTQHGDWSVVLVLVTIWFNVSVYNLVAASGRYAEERHSVLNARSSSEDQELTDDILDQAERGEFGLQAKREVLLAKVERVQTELGVCKLNLVQLQSHAVVHIVAMSLGIYADSTLRASVAYDHKAGVRVAVLHAMTFHLVMCILWLIVSVLASLYARTVKQEPRVAALWKYLLDV